MATRTIDELVTEARQRADMENDDSLISSSEAFRMVNQSIKELYDLLIENQGEEFYVSSSVFNTTSGINSYVLPADFYQLLGVDTAVVGQTPVAAKPYMFSERNNYILGDGWGSGNGIYYRLGGSKIYFIPQPTGVHQVTLWYIPAFIDLTTGQSFDGINGWEEYVVVDVAMKMREKEEGDVAELAARKMALTARIQSLASKRDAAFPGTIVDVYTKYWDQY